MKTVVLFTFFFWAIPLNGCHGDLVKINSLFFDLEAFASLHTSLNPSQNELRSISKVIGSVSYLLNAVTSVEVDGSDSGILALVRIEGGCLDSYAECSEKEVENILNGAKSDVLQESVRAILEFKDTLNLIPNALEAAIFDEESLDEENVSEILQKCHILNMTGGIDTMQNLQDVKQCGINMLGQISMISGNFSTHLDNVEKKIYKLIVKLRKQKTNLDVRVHQSEREWEEARLMRDRYDIYSLRNQIASKENLINQYRDQLESKRKTGLGVVWIPIAGWIAAGVLISEMDELENKIGRLNSEIDDFNTDINSFYHNSFRMAEIGSDLDDMRPRLKKIESLLGLTEKFDNSLTTLRDYWRKVSKSYLQIKEKSEESIDDMENENKTFSLKADISAMYEEVKSLTVYINELKRRENQDGLKTTLGLPKYTRSFSKMDQKAAVEFCRTRGQRLAEIRSKKENDDVMAFLSTEGNHVRFEYFWIALTDPTMTGRYVWMSDNQAPSYTNWEMDEPSIYPPSEHCVNVGSETQHRHWNNIKCSTDYIFALCQSN